MLAADLAVMSSAIQPPIYTLWVSCPVPSKRASWFAQATANSKEELELKANGVRNLFKNRQFSVMEGVLPPFWRPVA